MLLRRYCKNQVIIALMTDASIIHILKLYGAETFLFITPPKVSVIPQGGNCQLSLLIIFSVCNIDMEEEVILGCDNLVYLHCNGVYLRSKIVGRILESGFVTLSPNR